jgi:FtsZ-interacting cell division protein YlmF
MSEYQYYEFQAIDRPLTQQQMAELRSVSTRARITATSFTNEYHWGDFKGDPGRWMERYFDAFLYFANWGTRHLMLRLPSRLLPPNMIEPYCGGHSMSCRIKSEHVILSYLSESEEFDWDEDGSELSSLTPLRADMLRGDYRCLYLGWLLAVEQNEFDDATPEPPVPPVLKDLTGSLQSLSDFLRIDRDLVAAAAEASPNSKATGISRKQITEQLAKVPTEEKDEFLIRLMEPEDASLVWERKQRVMRDDLNQPAGGTPRRQVAELRARAETIRQARERAEADRRAHEKAQHEREHAQRRTAYLDSLAGREEDLWQKVNQLVATKQPKRYDEAVTILKDLRDLSARQGDQSKFRQAMGKLHDEQSRKPTLVDRLRAAGL